MRASPPAQQQEKSKHQQKQLNRSQAKERTQLYKKLRKQARANQKLQDATNDQALVQLIGDMPTNDESSAPATYEPLQWSDTELVDVEVEQVAEASPSDVFSLRKQYEVDGNLPLTI